MIKILLSMLLVGIVAAQNASNETTAEPFVTTETTTKLQPTTTKAPSSFVNVTIPKNSPNYTCLKLQSDMKMSIKYAQQFNATTVINGTVDLDFPSSSYDYDGTCEKDKVDTVTITFLKTWSLYMEYTLDKSNKYELASIILTYTITDDIFPNATKDSLGKQFVANASGLTLFQGSKDSAYKCNAKTTVELDSMVNLILSNYLAQPFYEKPNGDFGTAIDCAADTTGTNKLVPIIVGAALAFLVILVLIAYLIGRRRHRSGYQSV